jgi:ElaB/YqjD/DUF883 family membrane-anchored ribosome-binding protein
MTIEPANPTTLGQGDTSSTQSIESRVTDDLGKVGAQAKHDLEAIGQKAAQDVDALKHKAGEQLGAAADKARGFAGDQKSLAADQINGVATAISKVADELSGSDQPTIARYARELASGISGFGKTVADHDVDDLMSMAQDFGRRQPLAFLGAAALAGFVASRFALASAHRDTADQNASGTGGTQNRQEGRDGNGY